MPVWRLAPAFRGHGSSMSALGRQEIIPTRKEATRRRAMKGGGR